MPLNEHARLPDQDPQPASSSNIYTFYEALGENFEQTLSEYVAQIKKEQDARRGVTQDHSFYLNSSDSLTTLQKIMFEQEKVLTVAGSGEFAHIMINNGANEVCSFDISAAAAFNAELRQVALCNLNMEQYIQLFGAWTLRTDIEDTASIWDQEIYQQLEHLLSPQARYFFKLIFADKEFVQSAEQSWSGFARVRYHKQLKNNRVVGDLITNEDEYNQLQQKAREVIFVQVIADANKLTEVISDFGPDSIYMSNIGYGVYETLTIAHNLLTKGARRVICTVSNYEQLFGTENEKYDRINLPVMFQNKVIEVGETFDFNLYDDDENVVRVKLIAKDHGADYGITLEVTLS